MDLLGVYTYKGTLQNYYQSISKVIDEGCCFIFDTNVIADLYSLNDAARVEFLNWIRYLVKCGNVFIPKWVANEYFYSFSTDGLKKYAPSHTSAINELKKSLEKLKRDFSFSVDLDVMSKDGEKSFSTICEAIAQNVAEIEKLSRNKNLTDIYDVHEEIVNCFAPAVGSANIMSLANRAAAESPVRVLNKLPPAYKDGRKDHNPYGDLIIWFEILDIPKVKGGGSYIFVSNDVKPDWVQIPKKRLEEIKGANVPVLNESPKLKFMDPRLVDEFKLANIGSDILFLEFSMLVQIVSNNRPSDFSRLAAAVQLEGKAQGKGKVSTNSNDGVNDNSLPTVSHVPSDKTPVASSLILAGVDLGLTEQDKLQVAVNVVQMDTVDMNFSPDALSDERYAGSAADSEIDKIIKDLKSYNWYVQNPAISRILDLSSESYTADAWFVLGRNVYQAACGNSQRAMSFVNNIERNVKKLGVRTGSFFLAGVIFEIYFDGKGRFREFPKFDCADKPLRLVLDSQYRSVLEFIRNYPEGEFFRPMYRPGESLVYLINVSIDLDAVDEYGAILVESIKYADHDLLSIQADHDNTSGLGAFFYFDDIARFISKTKFIPSWALKVVCNKDFPDGALFCLGGNHLDVDIMLF